ncbi:AAA family ATPase [Rhodothermus marinus]|uniref:AAA family ATPase n=1 Tax=Rhodothermus marinus TaxID=29549 RepID=UPI000ADB8D45|nr:AAA family ATPase [Rhodothermus marinus]
MLRTLYIRDYALIEELEVEFGSGLNILTGETGAGKSILIGALKMILGERADTEMIRSGARKAVVEGVFDEADTPRIRALLEANAIDDAAAHRAPRDPVRPEPRFHQRHAGHRPAPS